MYRVTMLALLSLGSLQLLHAQEQPVSPGSTKESSIEVCDPAGERAYLGRLICKDDSHPQFKRLGSVGMRQDLPPNLSEDAMADALMSSMGGEKIKPGELDHHTVDSYSVECGSDKTVLFLDMYHCDAAAPQEAPAGFRLMN
ncbi:hypothetical protein [Pseudoxanthomonas sp. GM95]|uniref:hypothetical protein n=1 Tax=Pseudoxanthomonas sp. GM95 TaxID=1881043 RepID=UPI001113A3AA|nr:hypothetical protein [Pseudoxanthomonas sp. GM95]